MYHDILENYEDPEVKEGALRQSKIAEKIIDL